MSIFILFWGDYLGNLNSNSQNKTHGLLYFQVENEKKKTLMWQMSKSLLMCCLPSGAVQAIQFKWWHVLFCVPFSLPLMDTLDVWPDLDTQRQYWQRAYYMVLLSCLWCSVNQAWQWHCFRKKKIHSRQFRPGEMSPALSFWYWITACVRGIGQLKIISRSPKCQVF